ncbi:LuxR C-terminal-related transcriptional regulator [Yokenella regensburgei]|uniref:LuxR C-terminal-related transcriptional regulator n=1 Tax=Yokenella regensburgei TaxID=158877 RepID=UPI0013761846|nr:LuxR C-terminal-related transcriptional regulator [Yokenella regensburgei]KAF1366372.1 DNA-binding CsgD family transcriptional regulator [Yokenella regensburgei]
MAQKEYFLKKSGLIVYMTMCELSKLGLTYFVNDILQHSIIHKRTSNMGFPELYVNNTPFTYIFIDYDIFLLESTITYIKKLKKRNPVLFLISKSNWPAPKEPRAICDNVFIINKVSMLDIIHSNFFDEQKLEVKYNYFCSQQEVEVMNYLTEGIPLSKSCKKLMISRKTFSSHLSNLKKKTQAHSNQNLVYAHIIFKKILSLNSQDNSTF